MTKDFGGFTLLEKIGSGGMASVYLGMQKSLDRKVVLKILYPHLAEDEKLVARFEREARAAALLKHENIVQVIDCGRHEGVAYIAMEFVEGSDLKKWLETWGPPPIEVALLMIHDACAGLEAAHQHHIVHRDIKPANLMFTPTGTIKIMDFGLARRGEDSATLTLAGSVMGTPAYMSPEQSTGEAVDERSDIFSAGVVAYELLGGSRPFQGDSYSTVLRSILTVTPPPLETLNPLIPPDVVAIVSRMLQKDASKRYPHISQVRGDLGNAIEQIGIRRPKELLRDYAQDPKQVGGTLRTRSLSRHLDQGLYFENLGLGKIDDAMLEFKRVLHLDPGNKTAREHVQKLERERTRASQAPTGAPAAGAYEAADPEKTLLMPAGEAISKPPIAPKRPAQADAGPAPIAGAPEKAAGAAPPARRSGAPAESEARVRPARVPSSERSRRERTLLLATAGALVVAVIAVAAVLLHKPKPAGEGETASGPPAATRTNTGGSSAAGARGTSQAGSQQTAGVGHAVSGGAPGSGQAANGPISTGTTAAAAAGESLRVLTVPAGARVMIDGRYQRQRAPAVYGDVGAGDHAVLVEKPEYVPQQQHVRIETGRTAQLKFKLDRASAASRADANAVDSSRLAAAEGHIQVRVVPFANFFVDDKPKSTNVPSLDVAVSPGKHTVKAVHPKLGTKEWKVDVRAGKAERLEYNFLTNSAGRISVTSGRNWAYVYLDGKSTGKTTPCVLEGLPPGPYTVSLVRTAFVVEGGEKSVTVQAGGTTEVSFALTPRK